MTKLQTIKSKLFRYVLHNRDIDHYHFYLQITGMLPPFWPTIYLCDGLMGAISIYFCDANSFSWKGVSILKRTQTFGQMSLKNHQISQCWNPLKAYMSPSMHISLPLWCMVQWLLNGLLLLPKEHQRDHVGSIKKITRTRHFTLCQYLSYNLHLSIKPIFFQFWW